MKPELSTLCYMEKDGQYLMLHRVVKKNDVNKDKWIGVGGHFERDESPEDCLLREVYEETGCRLKSWRFRGIVTFVSGTGITEYMHLFTSDSFEGEVGECDEGVLEWVDIEKVWNLNLWEGDKIFFRLIDEDVPFFSLKLVYNGEGGLVQAALNGKDLELFDILAEDGTKTGLVRERGVAHRDGSLHGTVHMWIVREKENGYDVLLQKRSQTKDSNPGAYDISSAGHIGAGGAPLPAALREMEEELGLALTPADLEYVGLHKAGFEAVFYGRPFRDRELSHVYVCRRPVLEGDLHLQADEVEAVAWMDLEDCLEAVRLGSIHHCIYIDELLMLRDYLYKNEQNGNTGR